MYVCDKTPVSQLRVFFGSHQQRLKFPQNLIVKPRANKVNSMKTVDSRYHKRSMFEYLLFSFLVILKVIIFDVDTINARAAFNPTYNLYLDS